MEQRWPLAILGIILGAGVGACLWVIVTRNLSATETVLLSVLLTILSVIASWVGSSFYAEYSFNKNLRTFALKAAEKVNNLSNELDRLSAFLQQELEVESDETPATALLARDLRIEAAVHVINTLKSVNDRSLSDWQGVIGDQISAERERREEREQHFRELVRRIERLAAPDAMLDRAGAHEHLADEVNEIKNQLRILGAQFGGVVTRRPLVNKKLVTGRCPKCSQQTEYRQRPKDNSRKIVRCINCAAELYSTFENGEFVLREREFVDEKFLCPTCGEHLSTTLDATVGVTRHVTCANCHSRIALGRRRDDIVVRRVGASGLHKPLAISEDLLARVQEAMPPQPWPHGASKKAALKLGISAYQVQRAIAVLMQRGVFKVQQGGRLFVAESPASTQSVPESPTA